MERKINLTRLRLRVSFFLIALLGAFFVFIGFRSHFGSHRLTPVYNTIIEPSSQQFIYHDFNHDGLSEHIVVKHDRLGHQDGIKYYTSNDGLVDQWTCGEPIFRRAIFFADFDGDHFDEVYFFTKGNDSLFLYAFDPRRKNTFIVFRKLIVTAPHPNPNPRKIWDVSAPAVVFFDSDNDGYKEIFINFKAGFSLYPRGIWKFDIISQKIVARTPHGAMVIGNPFLEDLNGDGIPEILMSNSGAPANCHDDTPFSDHYPWLMVFDLNLNFMFKPIHFPYPFSDIITRVWNHNEKKYLAVLYDYHGAYAFPPTLYLYTSDCKLLLQKKLSSKNHWRLFSLPEKANTHLYLINNAGLILELNEQLSAVSQKHVDNPYFAHLLSADFDNDGGNELFGLGTKGYVICEPDFSENTNLNVIKPDGNNFYSVKYNGKNKKPALVIQAKNDLYFFQYKKNPLHHLWYAFILLVLLFFYWLLNFIFNLLQNKMYNSEIRRELVQFSEKGLLILDNKGKIRFINATFEQLLKIHRHIRPGSHYSLALEECNEIVSLIDDLVKHLSLAEKEFLLQTSENKNLMIKFQGITLRGIFNIPVGFLIFIEAKSQGMLLDDRVRVWIQTIQKMAHDIKAPLSSIQLELQTLQMKLGRSLPEDQKIQSDFTLINSELQRVRELTKQFLRFTNLEVPKFQTVALQPLIQKSLQKFNHFLKDRLKIKMEIDPAVRTICADPLLLEMVLQIVLENAIEAMEGDGLILISANLIHNPEEDFNNFVEIEINDNGPGIQKAHLNKIFEPFYSTKSNGTGLGLAIAKNIIQAHQGKITVDSREGFSTVVRILLPLTQKKHSVKS